MVAEHGEASARRIDGGARDDEAPDRSARALRSVKGPPLAGVPRELDGLIHERARLGILSALSVNERLAFTELRQLLETTDGNLSAHARKLEDAGYIECRKSFAGRVPRTDYRLTPLGRERLTEYLGHMEALIRMTREG
jgi:DNA-binding HxlR family transcriptional regulator